MELFALGLLIDVMHMGWADVVLRFSRLYTAIVQIHEKLYICILLSSCSCSADVDRNAVASRR